MRFRRSLLWGLLGVLVLAGSVACGKREVDELRIKVAALERELAETRAKLADAGKASEEVRAKAEPSQTMGRSAGEDVLAAELTKVRVERDKLKQELEALRKRR